MSETNYFIENSANGDAVARAIGSLYVNSYTCPTEQFYECMMQTDKNVKHNFTNENINILVFHDNTYSYEISGNIEREEIISIAQNIKTQE